MTGRPRAPRVTCAPVAPAAAVLVAGSVLLVPEAALAYGGPGGIITGLGALLATIAAIVATLFGLLWFPMKRLVKTIHMDDEEEDEEDDSVAE